MANARLRNEPSIQWREQRQWATWRTSSGRFWRNCLVRPTCFNTLAQRGHESWSGLQVPLWSEWWSLYVFVRGATWVTTKRSQPTLRDLKQSLESLLLDTSRFSTGSVSASGSFWKLLDRHVTAGIQYARAAPKWHLLLGYLMTPRVSFFAYWPTLLYCQSFPKRLQWHVSTLRGYYKDTCSLKHSTSKLRDQLFCSGIWHLHEVSSMIPVHRKHSKQWKRELSGKPCRFFQLQLCWIQ